MGPISDTMGLEISRDSKFFFGGGEVRVELTVLHRRKSSVNFGGKTFFKPENYV